jgi:hypothetical protein
VLDVYSAGTYVLLGTKEPLGRRRKWEDKIKMGVKEIGQEGVDSTDLVQDRDKWRAVVNAVMNIRFP